MAWQGFFLLPVAKAFGSKRLPDQGPDTAGGEKYFNFCICLAFKIFYLRLWPSAVKNVHFETWRWIFLANIERQPWIQIKWIWLVEWNTVLKVTVGRKKRNTISLSDNWVIKTWPVSVPQMTDLTAQAQIWMAWLEPCWATVGERGLQVCSFFVCSNHLFTPSDFTDQNSTT